MGPIEVQSVEQGAIADVDLAKAFPVVWAWAAHFNFPRKVVVCVMRLLRAPVAVVNEATPDHHGHSLWVEGSCLFLRNGLPDASEVMKVYLALKMQVFEHNFHDRAEFVVVGKHYGMKSKGRCESKWKKRV